LGPIGEETRPTRALTTGYAYLIEQQDLTTEFANPSAWLLRFQLAKPVISCQSAAAAKRIPLEHELKSLLIDCDQGRALAHIRGDRHLSLRDVKDALALREAKLTSPELVRQMGITPGTLHPFHFALWNGVHLITHQVLSLPWVSTNAGASNEYVVFDPLILLRARHITLGNFEA
jgi:prolyl-tRNA editing enzyme YbaK/EbsC (Cys-tRNA(Pro) deacylase)